MSVGQKKGKRKTNGTSRSRRVWTKREKEYLITVMNELFTDPKWRLDTGQFRFGFFTEVEKKIIMYFPGTDLRSNPHIDSKIKCGRNSTIYCLTCLSSVELLGITKIR